MRPPILFAAAAILLLQSLPAARSEAAPLHPSLFPTPRSVTWGIGSFALRKGEKIVSDAPAEVTDFITHLGERTGSAPTLAGKGRIQFHLLKPADSVIEEAPDGARIPQTRKMKICLSPPSLRACERTREGGRGVRSLFGDEGYRIAVSKRDIQVDANTPTGLYYGSLTLLQLLQDEGKHHSFPVVTIEDSPAMPYRGVMVDISRGLVPNLPTFQRMIRSLAEMKINAVQPYIEDTYAFTAYPYIGRDRGAWTPDEVRQMVQVAQRYHVDLSPCFESLGHMGQILKHPELADLRESGDVITPAKEASYDFLRKCYTELAEAFPFPYLNVGCDETGSLGQGPSKPMADKVGVGKVYSTHLQRLDGLCHEVHRKMQFWGDMMLAYPGIVGDMPKDAIVMNWDYGTRQNFRNIGTYKGFGYQQIVCPGVQSWGAMFTDVNNAEPNIRGFVKEGKAAGALGMLNTAWRDNGEVFFDYDWYTEAIGAECAWAVAPAEGAAFDAAFEHAFFGPRSAGLARAFRAMSDSLAVQGSHVGGGTLGLYYADPFKDLSPIASARGKTSLDRLLRLAGEMQPGANQPSQNTEVLPYLQFAAARVSSIPVKYQVAFKAANLYSEALDAASKGTPESKEIAVRKLRDAIGMVATLTIHARTLQSEYAKGWLLENKQPGLQNVLDRYEPMLMTYRELQARMEGALAAFQNGKPLPSAAEMGVALPAQTASGYRIPERMSAPPAWKPAGALAIQIHLADPLSQPMPIQLQVKSADLPPNLPSLARIQVLDEAGKPANTMLCQLDALDAGHTVLTFILPAGAAGDLHLALDSAPATAADTVEVTPAAELKDGLWIHTSRYRTLLGPQGAHLFRWDATALAGRDVTVAGDDDWHGFDDAGGERGTAFTLKPLLRGPLCVQIQCDSADGFRKILTFYAGLGWYDTRFDSPSDFFWHYDDPAVMGASSPTPGSYRFSDGKTGPIPADGAPSESDAASWVAKYRPDGWTLGLISPEDHPVLRAGPGGSMGGVGVEGGGSTSHLITFADVTPDGPKTITDLFDSYTHLQKAAVAVQG